MENNARKQPPNGDLKPRNTRSTRKNATGAFVYFVCFVVSIQTSSVLAIPRLAVPPEGVAFGEIAAGGADAAQMSRWSKRNVFPSKLALGLVFALLGVLLLVAGGGLASHLRVM